MVLIQVNPISIQSSLDHQILYGVISQGPMPQLSLEGTIFIQQHCNSEHSLQVKNNQVTHSLLVHEQWLHHSKTKR